MRGHFREVSGIREKLCPKCEQWMPHDVQHFWPKKRYPDGRVVLSSWCRPCATQSTIDSQRRHPDIWRRHCDLMNERTKRLRREKKERHEAIQAHGEQVLAQVDRLIARRQIGRPRAAAMALDLLTRGWGRE